MSLFQPAVRTTNRIRLGLMGPAGSGKSFTALRIATALAGTDRRIAVIDSESGSASLYAGRANPDGGRFAFDTLDIARMKGPTPHDIGKYMTAIRAAADAGYPVLLIDGLSHVWAGAGGLLEMVDKGRNKNNFGNWADVTPKHNALLEAVKSYPGHVLVTLRTKTAYVLETNDRGKEVPKKRGMAAVQREGFDFELDVVLTMADAGAATIDKTRCELLPPGTEFQEAGADVAGRITRWLEGADDDPLGEPQGSARRPQGDQDDPTGWGPEAEAWLSTELRKHGLTRALVRDALIAKGYKGKTDPAEWSQERRDNLIRGLSSEKGESWERLGLPRPRPTVGEASGDSASTKADESSDRALDPFAPDAERADTTDADTDADTNADTGTADPEPSAAIEPVEPDPSDDRSPPAPLDPAAMAAAFAGEAEA